MARPAASSFALLMRKPVERRCKEVASEDWDVVRLRCAFSDEMLVVIVWARLDRLGSVVCWLAPGAGRFKSGRSNQFVPPLNQFTELAEKTLGYFGVFFRLTVASGPLRVRRFLFRR